MGDASGVAKMFNNLCSNIMVSYISEKYCSPYDYLLNSIKILATSTGQSFIMSTSTLREKKN